MTTNSHSKKLRIKIPYKPVSINDYYGKKVVKIKERYKERYIVKVYVKPKGEEFKRNVREYLNLVGRIKEIKYTKSIEVFITLNFKTKRNRDVDNFNKCILDSLNKFLWTDDGLIQELHIKKNLGTKTEDNFVIEIKEI